MNGDITADAVPLTFGDHYVLRLAAGVADESQMHFGFGVRLPGAPPGPGELCELIAKKVAVQAPALGYRLVGEGRRARWEPDPAFDPAYHVEYHRLPRGSDVHQAVMNAMAVRPLSRERPLWSLLVLYGHADDEHVLCYRAHHAFQDGMGAISAIRALTGDQTLPFPGTGTGTGTGTARAARPGTGTGAGQRRALADLLRLSGAPPRWFSSCATSTPGRRLHVAGLDVEPFHDIARATGASVAQIAIALVTGALRSWNPQARPDGGRDMVVALPVALLGLGRHTALGNHTGLLPVTLPCAEPSAIARLQQVVAQTTLQRISDARHSARALYRVPAALAVPLLRLLSPLARTGRGRQLNVSAVRMPRILPGAGEIFAVPPLAPGVAGMVVIVHAGAVVSFSGVFDARVSRPGELLGLLRPALTELHAAATR